MASPFTQYHCCSDRPCACAAPAGAGDNARSGKNDGKLSFDEWVVGMRKLYVNRDMTDEQFDSEMKAIVDLGKAMQPSAS